MYLFTELNESVQCSLPICLFSGHDVATHGGCHPGLVLGWWGSGQGLICSSMVVIWQSWGCACLAAPLGMMWQCRGVALVWWGSGRSFISLSSHLLDVTWRCGVVILVQWGSDWGLIFSSHPLLGVMWQCGGHPGPVE